MGETAATRTPGRLSLNVSAGLKIGGSMTHLTALDLNKRCPSCSCVLAPLHGKVEDPCQLAQCPLCPMAPKLCWSCLTPWQYTGESTTGFCKNKFCHVVSLLLTCETVTDSKSKIQGCPMFRACPMCHSLIMHSSGCKYMTCKSCNHKFCFICLEPLMECIKDKNLYFSPYCSKPRASRQIFHK